MRALRLAALLLAAAPPAAAQDSLAVVGFEWLGAPGEVSLVVGGDDGRVAVTARTPFRTTPSTFVRDGSFWLQFAPEPSIVRGRSRAGVAGHLLRPGGTASFIEQAYRKDFNTRAPHDATRFSRGRAINDTGVSTGVTGPQGACADLFPFRWSDDGFEVLSAFPCAEGFDVTTDTTLLVAVYDSRFSRHERMLIVPRTGPTVELPPTGAATTIAAALSDSGHVVGFTCQTNTCALQRGFVWHRATGYTTLEPFLGDAGGSFATDVNARGWVSGYSIDCVRRPNGCTLAQIWTAGGVRRDLTTLAARALAPGSALFDANAITNDGWVFGLGRNGPSGAAQVYRLRLVPAGVRLLGLPADTLVVAGTALTVRYEAPVARRVHVYLTTDRPFAPATARLEAVARDVPNTGRFVWDVPERLASPHVRLRVADADDTTAGAFSARLRVRPLRLARVQPDSTYDLFGVNRHGFAFPNDQANLFPAAWAALPRFQYGGGEDPFTRAPYNALLFRNPIVGAEPTSFPDWPSWVDAFGRACCYADDGSYTFGAVFRWGGRAQPWGGSCAGMAALALLAFGHPDGFAAAFPAVGPPGDVAALADTLGARPALREAINSRFAYQFGQSFRARYAAARTLRPRETLAEIRALLARDDRAGDAWLYLRNDDGEGSDGAHAVVPYRMSQLGTGVYDIAIYDPNRPGEFLAFVRIDSTADRWTYGGGLDWAGDEGLLLSDPVAGYVGPALEKSAPAADADLGVYAAGARVTLADAAGRTLGHTDGRTFEGLPGGYAEVPAVGGPSAPVGYRVPAGGAYRLSVAGAPGGAVRAAFETATGLVAYARDGAGPTDADALAFGPDGRLRARNPSGAPRTVTLATVDEAGPDAERAAVVEGLALAPADSVGFGSDGGALRLDHAGAPTSYALRLRRVGAAGTASFHAPSVPLGARSAHRIRPDWGALGTVEVDVDDDGDGTFDRTLRVANTVSAEPVGPPVPETALGTPAPNPAADRVAFRYTLGAAGPVRLAVYDALGRTVAVLADEVRPAGGHTATFRTAGLAPGVYVVRLDGAGAVRVRTFTVVR